MARTPDPSVRVALIEAAAQLLADEGLPALSIRRVATTVGCSTMAVYTHFGSKEDLVQEIVREGFARLHAELSAVDHSSDPVHDLVNLGAAYRRNALANSHLYRVMFDLNPLALTDPADHADAGELGLDTFDALVAAIARCVDAGVMKGDPRRLARVVWSTVHGAVSLELSGYLGEDGAANYGEATAATFAGLTQ